MLLSASFCFHFGKKKKKLLRVQAKIIKLFCVQQKIIKLLCVHEHKKVLYFFWHFFIKAVLVEMKRLKSFFLCNVVVLHVINKSFFFEKVVCSENETWTQKFLYAHFWGKIGCSWTPDFYNFFSEHLTFIIFRNIARWSVWSHSFFADGFY